MMLLILTGFSVVNFYLVVLSKSVIFAMETGLVLRQLGLLILVVGIGFSWLLDYDIAAVSGTVCVVFYMLAWLNVQIAVRLTKASMRIAAHCQ